MSEREVLYCTTEDGVRIAYCVQGAGLPMVVCPFFIESFAFDHLLPEVVDFMEMLGRGRALVRYDGRGTGLSDRKFVFGRQSFPRDLSAVADASAVDAFVLYASGTGGPGAIEYAATHPQRVSHLILFNTFARVEAAMDRNALEAMASLAESDWPMAAQTFADMTLRREFPEAALRWSEVFRRSASGEAVATGLRASDPGLDVSDLLSQITARTLVLHRLDGGIAPFEEGQRIAAAIPGARFVPLGGTAAHYSLGDTGPLLNAIDALLGDRPDRGPAHAPSTETAVSVHTVLFTDIESSTQTTQRLGDAAAQQLVRAHNSIVRDALGRHGGREIKHTGDGIMASFGSASGAVECAIAIQGAVAERAELPRLRIGLNAGEPIAEDGDLFGTTVQLARRICDRAEPGEVLVSDVVRQLAAGKRFRFTDAGVSALKGFDEPIHLYEVRWRE
ncbi:MAG: adenylate/guanylate cyclase domain-containing protein [Chloroflexota bacterium]|nr:adenylate/guanylate cyclase domain-containing protein [Chloroflexota bacterium]